MAVIKLSPETGAASVIINNYVVLLFLMQAGPCGGKSTSA